MIFPKTDEKITSLMATRSRRTTLLLVLCMALISPIQCSTIPFEMPQCNQPAQTIFDSLVVDKAENSWTAFRAPDDEEHFIFSKNFTADACLDNPDELCISIEQSNYGHWNAPLTLQFDVNWSDIGDDEHVEFVANYSFRFIDDDDLRTRSILGLASSLSLSTDQVGFVQPGANIVMNSGVDTIFGRYSIEEPLVMANNITMQTCLLLREDFKMDSANCTLIAALDSIPGERNTVPPARNGTYDVEIKFIATNKHIYAKSAKIIYNDRLLIVSDNITPSATQISVEQSSSLFVALTSLASTMRISKFELTVQKLGMCPKTVPTQPMSTVNTPTASVQEPSRQISSVANETLPEETTLEPEFAPSPEDQSRVRPPPLDELGQLSNVPIIIAFIAVVICVVFCALVCVLLRRRVGDTDAWYRVYYGLPSPVRTVCCFAFDCTEDYDDTAIPPKVLTDPAPEYLAQSESDYSPSQQSSAGNRAANEYGQLSLCESGYAPLPAEASNRTNPAAQRADYDVVANDPFDADAYAHVNASPRPRERGQIVYDESLPVALPPPLFDNARAKTMYDQIEDCL